ncbi:MAG: mersacidin/lichenicidin family type 2 lantibiotic [Pyrinomonadaceae bacterium]
MSPDEIIRAWKDEEYLSTLSVTDRAMLPEDPAGAIELSDRDLGDVNGGSDIPTGWICMSAATIAASTAVSALACASVMHGTCSGWSYGCC